MKKYFFSEMTLISDCCMLLLDLDKQPGTHIYKNITIYFYSSTVTLVRSERAVRESSHTQRSYRESGQSAGTDFSQNSRPYIVLELPRDSHGHASSPTQCLFHIGHGLNPCNTCFPLVSAYTHTLLFTIGQSLHYRLACFLVVT